MFSEKYLRCNTPFLWEYVKVLITSLCLIETNNYLLYMFYENYCVCALNLRHKYFWELIRLKRVIKFECTKVCISGNVASLLWFGPFSPCCSSCQSRG